MTLKPMDSAPLAERVRAAILEAILDKQFVGKLPPEDVLVKMLNVSRTTVRAALQSLEQEGVISRQRSIGTTINPHVRPSALALQRLVGFADLLEEKGYEVRVEADSRRQAIPPEMLTAFPRDISAGQALVTETQFVADDQLAIYIRDAVPIANLKDPDISAEQATADPANFDFSRPYCRRPVDHAVVEILAVSKHEQGTRLALAQGEAFTRLLERHYTSGGELMAVSIVDVDNNFIRFEVLRRR